MKTIPGLAVIVAAVILASPVIAQESHESEAYKAAVASYFEVPDSVVASVSATGIAIEELAVVFYVADLAKTSAESLAQLRVRGDSWKSINDIRHIGSDAFYIMIGQKFSSSTYSPLIGKFKMSSPSGYGKIPLADDDIINLVNLKFISSHYDYSMFEVMAMRDNGDPFDAICLQVEVLKKALLEEEKRKKRAAAKSKK